MSGLAAVAPTRPAISVLGGCATSSAPAFPSSCAAATAAAAAVRGSEVVYRCATIRDKTHHLCISVLYYSCNIGGIAIYELDTYLCQSLLSIAIPGIVDMIPRFAEILVLPARPAVKALRCRALTTGESICAVRRERKRSVSLQKPPEASFQGCQEFIGLISVGGAATEESTAAAAAGQTPGKTVAIAAGASTSTDFPYGRSGTGRLSFRLRRLQTRADKQAIVDLHVEGIIEYLLSM